MDSSFPSAWAAVSMYRSASRRVSRSWRPWRRPQHVRVRGLRRPAKGKLSGSAAAHAWSDSRTTTALALSFLGLWLLGIGFFVTSVWFWQVAGFSFAAVFRQRFNLVRGPA